MKQNCNSRSSDLLSIILGLFFPAKAAKIISDKLPSEIEKEFNAFTVKSLKSAPIPSTKISRAWYYSGLAASLGINAAKESAKAFINGSQSGSHGFLNDKSTAKLVDTLTKMRGAALKLGQMLSIQEENTAFPRSVIEIMSKVQNSAYAMPQDQLIKTFKQEFKNENWKDDIFLDFDMNPMAAASIGQVHKAKLKNSLTVAVKVQVAFS